MAQGSSLTDQFWAIWSIPSLSFSGLRTFLGIVTMFSNAVPDRTLLQKVNQRLMRMSGGSSVKAAVSRGDVTLSGMLPYETHRLPLIKAVNSVAGIRRVIDQLQVMVLKKNWQ
jgi:hypothetical protein